MSFRFVAHEGVHGWAGHITIAIEYKLKWLSLYPDIHVPRMLLSFPSFEFSEIYTQPKDNRVIMLYQAAVFGLFSFVSLTLSTRSPVQFVIDQFPPCVVSFECRWTLLVIYFPKLRHSQIGVSNLVNVPLWQRDFCAAMRMSLVYATTWDFWKF